MNNHISPQLNSPNTKKTTAYDVVNPGPDYRVRAMVLNTTFNKISVILWSVLLVEETGVHR